MSKRSTTKAASRSRRNGASHATVKSLLHLNGATAKTSGHPANQSAFSRFAQATSRWTGKPSTFLGAVALILIWAATGPLFGYSDTWQLIINTSTTIVTFLMVFLIQNTQNRDAMALQIKLAELIIAMRGAHNNVAAAEDLCEEDLEALHAEYRRRAEETLDTIEQRRGGRNA
jgi:low affinity Fe/Cu permease